MNYADPSGSLVRRAQFSDWVEGARLRTLPLAVAPVLLGSGLASAQHSFFAGRALLALVVALALQIGVNFANDYSDGIRGADEHRVGPQRLTGGRLVHPNTVKLVAFLFFGLACVAGLGIVALSGQWWLVVVGALAVLAAWFYTGGSHPYGYAGLGEVMVFVFFGLVATLGTVYVQTGSIDWRSMVCAVALGLFSCGVLMINNVRDIESDAQAGKITLAVILGRRRALAAYVAMVVLPYALLVPLAAASAGVLLGFISAPLAFVALIRALRPRTPLEQVQALKFTSLAALAFAALAALGLAVG